MSHRRAEIVVLLILLAQLAAAVGVRPRAAAFAGGPGDAVHGHMGRDGCDGGRDHLGHDPHDHPHARAHCHAAAAAVDLGGPESPAGWRSDSRPHCCECPHAHDHRGPQAPGSARDAKKSDLRPVAIASPIPAPPRWMAGPLSAARIRYLEADHPPPVGLGTTRLLI